MNARTDITQMRLDALIDAVAGNGAAPGSGAAAAVTLALAAACAAKAASISLTHRPQDHALSRARQSLLRVGQHALAGADRDAAAFTAFIREHSTEAVAQLIAEGDQAAHLIDLISALTDEIAPHIQTNMYGDIVAARALAQAARKIQLNNAAEAHEELVRQPANPPE